MSFGSHNCTSQAAPRPRRMPWLSTIWLGIPGFDPVARSMSTVLAACAAIVLAGAEAALLSRCGGAAADWRGRVTAATWQGAGPGATLTPGPRRPGTVTICDI